MVYRGKPSAGCENCRKAKKRCGLEQPACSRCVKLKKECTGYRDTTSLQIQDESQAVILKATKQKVQQASAQWAVENPSFSNPQSPAFGVMTPGTTHSDSSSSSDGTIELPLRDFDMEDAYRSDALRPYESTLSYGSSLGFLPSGVLSFTMKPTANDLAVKYFFDQFTAETGHWGFMRKYARKARLDPCLDLAIRACGMAAMDNVDNAVMGRQYSRSMYVEALGLLNAALRDPNLSVKDESLIAVAMLGYYENLTCDSRESIQSWKAHINGATQLLKLRGKAQFKTEVGRLLFRETRAQVLINAIWEDLEPPSFLWDWQSDLAAVSHDQALTAPADELTRMCYDFALLRAAMKAKTITDAAAADECFNIDTRMIQWSIDTMANGPFWRYTNLEVPDSPHVWNGMVHSYYGSFGPGVWNTWRGIRILVTRTQELLCSRLDFSTQEREEQTAYFRKVRRQMTEDICAGIPCMLGHAKGAWNSTCVLMTAYGSIWPLFFAATCALERIGTSTWEKKHASLHPGAHPTSAASAQCAWILGRMDFISATVGLKWASGIAAVLRGDFRLHDDLLPEDVSTEPWLQKIESSPNGAKVLLMAEGEEDTREAERGPVWLGRAIGENPRLHH